MINFVKSFENPTLTLVSLPLVLLYLALFLVVRVPPGLLWLRGERFVCGSKRERFVCVCSFFGERQIVSIFLKIKILINFLKKRERGSEFYKKKKKGGGGECFIKLFKKTNSLKKKNKKESMESKIKKKISKYMT